MPRALVIVDFQNDFTAGGALAVDGGETIAAHVNELAASGGYDLVVATRDWHPPHHSSFREQGGIWPVHCVQGTPGAELHPDLDQAHVDTVIDTGEDDAHDGYSGFDGTRLDELLRARRIDSLTIVGLATDYCVKHTALDALRLGYEVEIDSEAVRGVDLEPGDAERALDELVAAGAEVT